MAPFLGEKSLRTVADTKDLGVLTVSIGVACHCEGESKIDHWSGQTVRSTMQRTWQKLSYLGGVISVKLDDNAS